MGTGVFQEIERAKIQPSEAITMKDVFIRAVPEITERDEIKGLIVSLSAKYEVDDKCYDRIVECESNYRNIPNLKYGGDYGLGPAQLISSTAEYCSKKLGREIDRNNIVDNLECGAWLLKNEGTGHWGTENSYMKNGEKWGSWECFNNYCL